MPILIYHGIHVELQFCLPSIDLSKVKYFRINSYFTRSATVKKYTKKTYFYLSLFDVRALLCVNTKALTSTIWRINDMAVSAAVTLLPRDELASEDMPDVKHGKIPAWMMLSLTKRITIAVILPPFLSSLMSSFHVTRPHNHVTRPHNLHSWIEYL